MGDTCPGLPNVEQKAEPPGALVQNTPLDLFLTLPVAGGTAGKRLPSSEVRTDTPPQKCPPEQ